MGLPVLVSRSGSWQLDQKFSMSVEQQVRLFDNSTRLDQTFTELGLGYDLPKGFGLNLAYRFSWSPDQDGSFSNRHRYNVDITYGKKFKTPRKDSSQNSAPTIIFGFQRTVRA